MFDALKHATRRRVVRSLDPDEGWVALADLAERIAEDDPQIGVPQNPDRVTAALHHNHLPKLAECGLVEYDHREHRVVANDSEWAEPYLDLFDD